MISITKEFNFEMGHRLDGHKGKCFNVHGHNYKVMVTATADELDEMDMVVDFYEIVKIAKPMFEAWDHAFVTYTKAKHPAEAELVKVMKKHGMKVLEMGFLTTAENMAAHFGWTINADRPAGTTWRVSEVTVYETPTSFATWRAE